MSRAQDKIILITGGARGIGFSTAKLFKEHGATVIITDILENEGRAAALDIDAIFYPLDVADEQQWIKLAQLLKKEFGRIDILFNNAGITGLDTDIGPQDPEHCTLSAWHHVHQVNIDGVFLGCKYAIALMKKNGGSIINMSSRSGIVGIPTACAYASSKAAVRNHTKSVALYCATKGYHIRCNSLHPGAIMTPIWKSMLGDNEQERIEGKKNIEAGIPLGHMGEPLDVAYAVLYLGTDESKYITGTELTIDGGILAGCAASPGK